MAGVAFCTELSDDVCVIRQCTLCKVCVARFALCAEEVYRCCGVECCAVITSGCESCIVRIYVRAVRACAKRHCIDHAVFVCYSDVHFSRCLGDDRKRNACKDATLCARLLDDDIAAYDLFGDLRIEGYMKLLRADVVFSDLCESDCLLSRQSVSGRGFDFGNLQSTARNNDCFSGSACKRHITFVAFSRQERLVVHDVRHIFAVFFYGLNLPGACRLFRKCVYVVIIAVVVCDLENCSAERRSADSFCTACSGIFLGNSYEDISVSRLFYMRLVFYGDCYKSTVDFDR